ncbi:MAG: hypothetical protein MUD11_16935 [Rhodobacteraceae bacterium]|nr:hypothetical protein [Paracoccaceae bacterium]
MKHKFLGGVMTQIVQLMPAVFATALTLAFPLGAKAEVLLPPYSAIYGKVINVSTERVLTIETESSHSGDTLDVSAKLDLNGIDPFVLAALLEGRHVFCFPARQALTEQPLELTTCYLQINDLPGFPEDTNFVSLSYVLAQIQSP